MIKMIIAESYFYEKGAINDETKVVTDTQHNITIQHRTEAIGGSTYDVAYLG